MSLPSLAVTWRSLDLDLRARPEQTAPPPSVFYDSGISLEDILWNTKGSKFKLKIQLMFLPV